MNNNKLLYAASMATIFMLTACGGGGGSSSGSSSGGGTPPAATGPFTVNVNVSGMGSGVTLGLADNTTDPLTITASGSYNFANKIASGGAYNVVVTAQPNAEACTVSNGSGTATANVTVNVVCAISFTPVNTTVPAPVYSTDSALKTAYINDLNNLRAKFGISLVAQNTNLDTATQAHASYLAINMTQSMETSYDPATGLPYAHSEDVGNVGFYAATPQLRVTKAGYAGYAGEVAIAGATTSSPVTSNALTGDQAFYGLFNTIYHRDIMMQDEMRDIGIGFALPSEFVIDLGYTGVTVPLPSTFTFTYPLNGQTIDNPAWTSGAEMPNPTPTIPTGTTIGPPITFASGTGHTLKITSFTLVDSVGANVAVQQTNAVTDPTSGIAPNIAHIIPLAKLNLGSTYTATFTGSVDTTPVNTTWSFNTPAGAITITPVTSLTMNAGQTISIIVTSPSGTANLNVLSESSFTGGYSIGLSGHTYTFTTPAGQTPSQSTVTLQATDLAYSNISQTFTITVNP